MKSASFDAAFSTISFHHWDGQPAGIREVARVLKPGRLFILADIDAPLLFLTGPLLRWFDGSQVRAPMDIQRLLEQAGLSVVDPSPHPDHPSYADVRGPQGIALAVSGRRVRAELRRELWQVSHGDSVASGHHQRG